VIVVVTVVDGVGVDLIVLLDALGVDVVGESE
jgi:hypothetical protein